MKVSVNAAMCAAMLSALLGARAVAEDVYYDVPVNELRITSGELPGNLREINSTTFGDVVDPYVRLDGEGEAYLYPEEHGNARWVSFDRPRTRLGVRVAHKDAVQGTMFLPKSGGGMSIVRFEVPADQAAAEAKRGFHRGKQFYYARWRDRDVPGGAWFRYQAHQASKQAGHGDPQNAPNVNRGFDDDNLGGLIDFFSGGRAMSENLQLDRLLPEARGGGDAMVDLAAIEGITIEPYDFASKIKGKQIEVDPLSKLVPHDQHVLFFRSFGSLRATMHELAAGSDLFSIAEPITTNAHLFARYERQLCLPLDRRLVDLAHAAIGEIALTGSDPYFDMGTDVAVLMQVRQAGAIEVFVALGHQAAKQQRGDVQPIEAEHRGVKYRGITTPDRAYCSLVATLGDAVVVTNSEQQMRRVIDAHRGEVEAIAGLEEYRFFRDRYARSAEAESGLLFLSDATIRRWCSPRWRIGVERRVRAAAVLAHAHAELIDRSRTGEAKRGPIKPFAPIPGGGTLELTDHGLDESVYNTPQFMTPIAELNIERVTRREADRYQQWRRGYERNWTARFDPIALRFHIGADRTEADLTVMPLIAGTDYRQFIDVTRGVAIRQESGDRHANTLLHIAMAVNRKSAVVQQVNGLLRGMMPEGAPVEPLGWLGESVAIYVDDDPFWREARGMTDVERARFMERNVNRMPIVARVDVADRLQFAAFMAAARAYVDQTAPGTVRWENRKHGEQTYVRVSALNGRNAAEEMFAIYYAITSDAIVLTLNEEALKRAMDRDRARDAAAPDEPPTAAKDTMPWLGDSLGFHLDRKAVDVVMSIFGDDLRQRQQAAAWSNIPILNEWRRLYPQRDPVEVHRAMFGVTLMDPAGGSYSWDTRYQTMASQRYGHPGEPREGPVRPAQLESIRALNFGLTFEADGLRARAVLHRFAPAE